jgi:MFS family permease
MQNRKALTLLFAANSVAGFAHGITMLAVPWYLVNQSGKAEGASLNGIMMGSVTLLTLFWSLFTGPVIDRFDRKQIFQGLNLIGAIVLGIAALSSTTTSSVPYWALFAVTACTLFNYNLHYPNLYAFTQEILETKYLGRVTGAIEFQGQITAFFGMAVGSMLLSGSNGLEDFLPGIRFEGVGMNIILGIDAIAYFISFMLLSQLKYIRINERILSRGNILKRLNEGVSYLKSDRNMLIFGNCSFMIFLVLMVLVQVLLPVYIGPFLKLKGSVFAFFEGVYSLGAMVAGLAGIYASKKIESLRADTTIILLLLSSAVLFILWAIFPGPAILVIGGFFLGIFNAGARVIRLTYILKIVPNEIIGRINTIFQLVNLALRGILILMLGLPFFDSSVESEKVLYGFWISAGILIFSAVLLNFRFSRTPVTQKIQ